MTTPTVTYIGKQPIYWQAPRYVEYVPTHFQYEITSAFGVSTVVVHRALIECLGEQTAVAFTAWGDIREANKCAFGLLPFGKYADMRKAFVDSVKINETDNV